MLAMQHVVSSSISMCDVDVRPSLWSNIILAGGTTLMSVSNRFVIILLFYEYYTCVLKLLFASQTPYLQS